MKNPQVTYTATFANGATYNKATRAARGFEYALQVIFDGDETGPCGVTFSATKAGCMRTLNDFQETDNVTRWEIVKAEPAA